MNKRRAAMAILAIAVAATLAFAQNQKSTVIGTVHDINLQGCFSCHAPHNGSVATGGTDQQTGQILLWDRGFTAQTFGTYDSPSMDNTAAEVGGTPISATEPRLFSFLCLSCHDGVTSPTLIGPTVTDAVGNPTNSFGLSNDHPVNMAHDPTQDTGLNPVATVTAAGLALYGTTNTVQCGSCHNVHDNTNLPFLRISNANSALCTTCHL
ncbi:MAG: cytochrome c3 family protein [Terriglobia bacterium]